MFFFSALNTYIFAVVYSFFRQVGDEQYEADQVWNLTNVFCDFQ